MAKLVFNAGVFKDSPLFAASTATQISVLDRADDTLASLWSDRDGLVVKSNPFFISSAGKIEFYADPGRYRVTAQNGGFTQIWEDVLLIDPNSAGGGGTVDSVVAGAGVVVDDSDTANPIVGSNFTAGSASSSYTLGALQDNQWLDLDGATAIDITCPPESSVDLGDEFVHVVSNYGTGAVSIVAGAGVTVRPPPGGTLVIPQYATAGIKKAAFAANTYIVFGLTTAAS